MSLRIEVSGPLFHDHSLSNFVANSCLRVGGKDWNTALLEEERTLGAVPKGGLKLDSRTESRAQCLALEGLEIRMQEFVGISDCIVAVTVVATGDTIVHMQSLASEGRTVQVAEDSQADHSRIRC
jgi:hypothetical protein